MVCHRRAISAGVSTVNILPSTFSFDAPGVFVGQGVKAGGGQRLLLAEDAFHFGDPGVGGHLGRGEGEPHRRQRTPIPKGLNHPAQGWPRRAAYPGKLATRLFNSEGIGSIPHIPLIEFILKGNVPVMLLLPGNVLPHRFLCRLIAACREGAGDGRPVQLFQSRYDSSRKSGRARDGHLGRGGLPQRGDLCRRLIPHSALRAPHWIGSSRNAWRPAEDSGCFLPSAFSFQSVSVSAFRFALVAGFFDAVFHYLQSPDA